MGMLCAAIDIDMHVFRAAVLDVSSGEIVEARVSASREVVAEWAGEWEGKLAVVVIEAACGWRWVWRELAGRGFDVRLAEPAQTWALRGKKREAKTDCLDVRWLALLLAREVLPCSWIPARGRPAAARPDPAAAGAPP